MAKMNSSGRDRRSGSGRLRRLRFWGACLAVLGAVGGVCGAVSFWSRASPAAKIDVAAEGDSDPGDQTAANPGYLGPQACAACHAERVAEFLGTNHFHTFRLPDP